MSLARRALAPAVALGCGLLLAAGLPPAQAASLPETVVVHDTRTSDPAVDISLVKAEASWYWDSEQIVRITVPKGFRPGHRVDVFFDLDGDSTPDGHYDLRLMAPKHKGGKQLRWDDGFRIGGGWKVDAGKGARCSDSEGASPAAGGIRVGQREIDLGLDLWDCLQVAKPAGTDSGSWRVAVRVAKGTQADMAPNGQKWSKAVAGWGPCDPSGGQCP